jgi:hypothetical protein
MSEDSATGKTEGERIELPRRWWLKRSDRLFTLRYDERG